MSHTQKASTHVLQKKFFQRLLFQMPTGEKSKNSERIQESKDYIIENRSTVRVDHSQELSEVVVSGLKKSGSITKSILFR